MIRSCRLARISHHLLLRRSNEVRQPPLCSASSLRTGFVSHQSAFLLLGC